jgi:hypothetical protein
MTPKGKPEVTLTFDLNTKDLSQEELAALIDEAFKNGKDKLMSQVSSGASLTKHHDKVTVVHTHEKSSGGD